MAKRRRSREWKAKLTEDEYQKLKAEAEERGITCLEYGERALFHKIILDRDEQEKLHQKRFCRMVRRLLGAVALRILLGLYLFAQ